jgi:hypothetical protein
MVGNGFSISLLSRMKAMEARDSLMPLTYQQQYFTAYSTDWNNKTFILNIGDIF